MKNARYSDSSYPGPEDDIRENIINYEDEVKIIFHLSFSLTRISDFKYDL